MKKILIAALIVTLAFSIIGCAATEPEVQISGHSFTYNETVISLNTDAAPILAALGEPKNYTEETSCAYEGLDKTYYYGSFYLTTYPKDETEYIRSVWFVDDGVATADGIRIGSTKPEVEAAYGRGTFNGVNAYNIINKNTQLTIILIDGSVSSIQYKLIN